MAVDYLGLASNMQTNRQLEQNDLRLRMLQQQQNMNLRLKQQQFEQNQVLNPIIAQQEAFNLQQAQALGPLNLRLKDLEIDAAQKGLNIADAQELRDAAAAEREAERFGLEKEVFGLEKNVHAQNILESKAKAAESLKNKEILQEQADRQKGIDNLKIMRNYALEAQKLPAGEERDIFVKNTIPKLKKLGIGVDGELDQLLEDGVNDQELAQFISQADALVPREQPSLEDQIALEKLAIEKRKDTERQEERKAQARTGISMAQGALGTVRKLLNFPSDQFEQATGSVGGLPVSLRQDTIDVDKTFDTLESQITGANLEKMSGALSDRDLQVLAQIEGNLNQRQSPEALRETLRKIESSLLNSIDITKQKYGFEGQQQTGQTQSIDTTADDFELGDEYTESILRGYGL